ncbi:GNAT family N-acetyltransferase [Pedobacter aquatilis]|uniref:GNAT family N-acetyltransferase n=1 Tax=Pedobacter aquatilis TaxID=351343 RepID=UPI0033905377
MLGNEICGLVDYHVQPLPWNSISHPKNHNSKTVFISDFIIHPRFRRIGLATMLLGIVKNYSRYLGKMTIRTAISREDPVLLQFFETMGFVPGGIPWRTDEHIYEFRLCGRLRKD